MFQKIAKHRANDASNDVHRPPLVQNINVEHYITPLLKEVKPDPEKRVSENMLSVHEILSLRESNRS